MKVKPWIWISLVAWLIGIPIFWIFKSNLLVYWMVAGMAFLYIVQQSFNSAYNSMIDEKEKKKQEVIDQFIDSPDGKDLYEKFSKFIDEHYQVKTK